MKTFLGYFKVKFLKKYFFVKKLNRLMKSENIEVRKYCETRDWKSASKWLHINKASFKAFRRVQKLNKNEQKGKDKKIFDVN
jgi:hypothetical protein